MEGGYYADPAFQCQAFHICVRISETGLQKYSFLCPNGSLFYQEYFVCDYWFNVDCSQAEANYNLNEVIAAEREANIGAVSADDVVGEWVGDGETAGQPLIVWWSSHVSWFVIIDSHHETNFSECHLIVSFVKKSKWYGIQDRHMTI